MDSTSWETAQATQIGQGFDYPQVHDYDLCDIYKPLYSTCAIFQEHSNLQSSNLTNLSTAPGNRTLTHGFGDRHAAITPER